MLLIRKSGFMLVLGICAAIIIVSAAAAYYMLYSAGMQAESITGADLRFLAEKILFAGLIELIVLITVFIVLFTRSRDISKDLDKLIKQNRLNSASTVTGLLTLGETGKQLNILFRQLEEISYKRGLKIGALSNVAEFLSQHIESHVTIVDVTGRIIQVSRGSLETAGKNRNEIVDRTIDILAGDIQFTSVLSELEKQHLPVETASETGTIRWIPLLNRRNEISYIAVIQDAGRLN